jgi:RimJ/RimL family protein N-acetyltransferase
MINIRPILIEDGAVFLKLLLTLDGETRFMMLEPGERVTDVKKIVEFIVNIKKYGEIFIVENEQECVGFLSIQRETYRRNWHCAYIVTGIVEAFRGKGWGTRLFQTAEAWARGEAIHRLELTVMAHNTSAIALYKKMGFEVEGTKRHSLKVDGQYVDEYYMAKLLN